MFGEYDGRLIIAGIAPWLQSLPNCRTQSHLFPCQIMREKEPSQSWFSHYMLKVTDEIVSDSSQTVIISPARRTPETEKVQNVPQRPQKIRKLEEMRWFSPRELQSNLSVLNQSFRMNSKELNEMRNRIAKALMVVFWFCFAAFGTHFCIFRLQCVKQRIVTGKKMAKIQNRLCLKYRLLGSWFFGFFCGLILICRCKNHSNFPDFMFGTIDTLGLEGLECK
jgi:hypothetical protein